MTKHKKIILFLKVFLVLFITGVILPRLINAVINKVLIINDKFPSGNSIFVMDNNSYEISFMDIFFQMLRKMIIF